ncbi:maleylpyruvate isomerase family mycothiol-dependent enzyme [Mucilaginibacter daejeonensis]|uniref:maleylpyruvate isomerase family mycothiol-dependent enzyme n=1 Tax=Mucilaginibacter daejeonensis TaxID=398049 RepID=UPI001D173086|nr:maleylpyruvate isomerase family mycothiol-dependent enzyme [Mucilaginibacter daejeonensis]UEG55084.1 maleylpyruvate isomerase family mycothiol-dependent enzyme [Mucilaginibacter daejeonensis]
MDRGVPIPTLHLFSKLDQLLIELLKGLSADDWDSPTISPQWTIKDIAAHLLDGNLRTLSMIRDGYRGDPPTNVNNYRDLVNYLNDLNTIWVLAYKRISPKILIEQLESTGREYVDCLQRLEPFETAMFPVAWAGEEVSENWFHIAREYTEKWHHQQQIREALGLQHPLMAPELLQPCLETFVRALPYAYRDVNAPIGTIIKLVITGEGGGTWFAERTYNDWRLVKNLSNAPSAATATITDSLAWKLFTKALTPQQAHEAIQVEGESSLIAPLLSMVAVMA